MEITYLPKRVKNDNTAKEITKIIKELPDIKLQRECRLTLDMLLFMYNLCSGMISVLTQTHVETPSPDQIKKLVNEERRRKIVDKVKKMMPHIHTSVEAESRKTLLMDTLKRAGKEARLEARRMELLEIAEQQAREYFGERNPVIPNAARGALSKKPSDYCPYYFQEIGWNKVVELWKRQKNQLTAEDKKKFINDCFDSSKGFMKTVRSFETWRRPIDWRMKDIINEWLEKETNNSVFIPGENLDGQQKVSDEVKRHYTEYSKDYEKFKYMWSEIIQAIVKRKNYSIGRITQVYKTILGID